MDYCHLLSVIVTLYLSLQGVLSVGVALLGPKTVLLGQPFTLECIIPQEDLQKGTDLEYYKITNNQPEIIYQYRISSEKRIVMGQSFRGRVDLTFEPPTSFRVTNSTTSDDGLYKCQMYDYVDLKYLDANKTVRVVQQPSLHLASSVTPGQVLQEGDQVVVNCTARRHYPRVDIVWLLDDREFMTSSPDHTEEISVDLHDDNTNTTWVQRTFTVNKNHLGKTLTCKTVVPHLGNVLRQHLFLNSSVRLTGFNWLTLALAVLAGCRSWRSL